MKLYYLLASALVFIFSILVSYPVFASNNQENITIKQQVINSDLVKVGNTVSVSGSTIHGDAYLIGKNVNFSGIVTGDLFIISGNATIFGAVGQDLRVIAGNMFLDGKVGRNISFIVGKAVIEDYSYKGSLLSIVGNLISNASFEKGAKILGGTILLNGKFDNEVKIIAKQELIFGQNFHNTKRVFYSSPKPAHIDSNARVSGPITYDNNQLASSFPNSFTNTKLTIMPELIHTGLNAFRLFMFIINFSIGYFLLHVFSEKLAVVSNMSTTSIVKLFSQGVLIVAGFLFVLLFLVVTIIGIPLAILLIVIVPFVLTIILIVGSYIVGRNALLFLEAGDRRGWALFFGLFIGYLFSSIKTFGFFYQLLLIIITIGILFNYYLVSRNKIKGRLVRRKRRR